MDGVALPLSEPPARDWSLLPLDTLASILVRLGTVEVLMGAGLVCHSWLEAAKLPDVWRAVDMEENEIVFRKNRVVLRAMAKVAVDRADGQLRVFTGRFFVNDELLQYILERSPSLSTLRLVWCDVFNTRLVNVIRKSPLLELRSLELEIICITVGVLSDVLESCPRLKVLQVRDCSGIKDHHLQALRPQYPWIECMTVECDVAFHWPFCSD